MPPSLPDSTLAACRAADAVLLAAVAAHVSTACPGEASGERLLALRAGMELFANLRPVKIVSP